jgi:biopolymer transport protein ExbD
LVSPGAKFVALGLLAAGERLKIGGDTAQGVNVRGQRDAPFGAVARVMDRLAQGGVRRAAIVMALIPLAHGRAR